MPISKPICIGLKNSLFYHPNGGLQKCDIHDQSLSLGEELSMDSAMALSWLAVQGTHNLIHVALAALHRDDRVAMFFGGKLQQHHF